MILVRMLKARRWVAVLGPRMVGKTSLLKAATPILTKEKIKVVYVNLWGAKGTDDFLKALAQALNEEKNTINKIKDIKIEGASFGSGGISITLSKRPMATIWDLLGALGRQKEDYRRRPRPGSPKKKTAKFTPCPSKVAPKG